MPDTPQATTSTPTATPTGERLVHHSRRRGWGCALLVWEREGKRGYLFEDGTLRVFAESYYDLLQPAAEPDPLLRREILQKAKQDGHLPGTAARSGAKQTSAKPTEPQPTLEDQITVFEQAFEDGFGDSTWIETHRARSSGRQLKRHRDPAIAAAAKRLSQEALDECIAAGRHGEVFERVVEVVKETDLATSTQVATFEGLRVDEGLAIAMRDFLHDIRAGDLASMARLRRELAKAGVRKIPWTMLTAPRALLHPHDHMWVRPSAVKRQAQLLMPRCKPEQQPSSEGYSRCLELAMAVREQLTKAGHEPRDLFDVTDFMWTTLRSAADKDLVRAMIDRRAKPTNA